MFPEASEKQLKTLIGEKFNIELLLSVFLSTGVNIATFILPSHKLSFILLLIVCERSQAK